MGPCDAGAAQRAPLASLADAGAGGRARQRAASLARWVARVSPCRAEARRAEHGFGRDRRRAARRASTCEWGHQRRRRDSNPRYPCEYAGFQNRCLKPLGHSSGSEGDGVVARLGAVRRECGGGPRNPGLLRMRARGRSELREGEQLVAKAQAVSVSVCAASREACVALHSLRNDFATDSRRT